MKYLFIQVVTLLFNPALLTSPANAQFDIRATSDSLPIVGEKFCDVNMIGTVVQFHGVKIGDKIYDFKTESKDDLADLGFKDFSALKMLVYARNENYITTGFIFDNCVLVYFKDKNDVYNHIPLIIRPPDKKPIFLNTVKVSGMHIVMVSATRFISTNGIDTFSKIFGWTQPELINPSLEIDSLGNITIRDKVIRTTDNQPGKYCLYANGKYDIVKEE